MKPPPFSYHDPRSINDVINLLGRLDNARLLAGGQSLMPMLNMRFVQPDGGMEPIGNRIITVPENQTRARLRDPHSGFIDYVPTGSIAKGEALVTTGDGGKTISCAICHGPTLQGLGEVPAIVGRPPTYVVRQLNDMKTGARSGDSMALMKAVVEKLTVADMVSIAAYLGSRGP